MLHTSIASRSASWPPGLNLRDSMTDLIARVARERSAEAFRRLYDDYWPRIRAYMLKQGADVATAEELAQETLLAVWRKAALYAPEKGTPTTWIFTIARNLRIDKVRRETGWQTLGEEHAHEIPSDDVAADEAVSLGERQERVRRVLDSLPADQRDVIALAFVEGLSHSQIAEKLSLPLGTVKSRVRLAYQKVRDALEDLR